MQQSPNSARATYSIQSNQEKRVLLRKTKENSALTLNYLTPAGVPEIDLCSSLPTKTILERLKEIFFGSVSTGASQAFGVLWRRRSCSSIDLLLSHDLSIKFGAVTQACIPNAIKNFFYQVLTGYFTVCSYHAGEPE